MAAMPDWLLFGLIGLAILAVVSLVVWFYGRGGPQE
jgi:hypothetical protein